MLWNVSTLLLPWPRPGVEQVWNKCVALRLPLHGTLWQVQAALQVLRQRMTVPQFVLRILSGHKIMKIIEKRFYIESTGANGGPWQWPMVATV